MPKYGSASRGRLSTCCQELQDIFDEVIKDVDCSILEGHREEDRQNTLFDQGRSQVRWPNGKHNSNPSDAVDAAPWPIDWGDRERFFYFAGFVVATGKSMGIDIRWGGDWDSDNEFDDNNFDDLPHFEVRRI